MIGNERDSALRRRPIYHDNRVRYGPDMTSLYKNMSVDIRELARPVTLRVSPPRWRTYIRGRLARDDSGIFGEEDKGKERLPNQCG